MVNKNIQMKKKNGESWTNLFPISLTENIFNKSGENIESIISKVDNDLNVKITQVNSRVSKEIPDLENKINTRLDKEFPVIQEELKQIQYLMPKPSSVSKNTQNLQSLLDKTLNGGSIKIKFPDGTYELNICFINSNTELELSEGTVLKGVDPSRQHLFRTVRPTDSFTNRNGHKNIKIHGGKVEGHHLISAMHTKNLTIENMELLNADADHWIELCACENVKIENVDFKGVITQPSNRHYVEMVQFDPATSGAFPWLNDSNSISYDGSTNKNVVIEGCTFDRGTKANYTNIYSAIGAHTQSDNKHKGLTIRNCVFKNIQQACVQLESHDRVTIEGNTFIDVKHAFQFNNTEKVIFRNNHVTGQKQNIGDMRTSFDVTVSNNLFENTTQKGSNLIYVLDCPIFTIKDNVARNIKRTGEEGFYFVRLTGDNMREARGFVYNNETFTSPDIISAINYSSPIDKALIGNTPARVKLANGTFSPDVEIPILNDIKRFNVLQIATGNIGGGTYHGSIIMSYDNRFRVGDKFSFDVHGGTAQLEIVSSTRLKMTNPNSIPSSDVNIRFMYGIRYETYGQDE